MICACENVPCGYPCNLILALDLLMYSKSICQTVWLRLLIWIYNALNTPGCFHIVQRGFLWHWLQIANVFWPRGYKTCFMLNSAEHKICLANKSQTTNNYKFFLAKHSWAWKVSLLINMKMPTIVGIFTFISRENFMLSRAEHEKRFITWRPVLCLIAVFGLFEFYRDTFTDKVEDLTRAPNID